MTAPIFTPFVMEGVVKNEKQREMTPRRIAGPFHPAPVVPDPSRASGVRPVTTLRQRYRVIQPVNRVLDQQQQSQQHPIVKEGGLDRRYRRPKLAHGSGEPIGKPQASMISFAKTASFLPSRTKKRVFFEDGDDETLAQRVLAQGMQGQHAPPQLTAASNATTIVGLPSKRKLISRDSVHHEMSDMGLVGRNVEIPSTSASLDMVPKHDMGEHVEEVEEEGEYEEVDIDGLEEEAPRLSPSGLDPSSVRRESSQHGVRMDHLRGSTLREGGLVGGYTHLPHISKMRATTAAVKQLNGENAYLKDQLDACYYRIKQLETLLLERNMRLKQMLCDNLRQSTKMRKLVAALGEDAAAEALEGMEE